MSLSALTCPHCVGSFLVDSSMAGQEALCPNCKGMVLIPPVEPAAPPVPMEGTTQFACPVCFQAFGALASMAGQRVMCPHCGSTVMVPHAQDVEIPIPAAPTTQPPVTVNASQAAPTIPPPERPVRPTAVVEPISPPKPPSTQPPSTQPPLTNPPLTNPPAPLNRPVIAPAAASRQSPLAQEDSAGVFDPPAPLTPTGIERPIRKLSPEERARYRLIKNAVVLVICAAVLGALFLVLRYVPILKELSQRVEFIYDLGWMI